MKGLKLGAPLVVPGSREQEQADREGPTSSSSRSGAEWREPGCSMCIAMNGDELKEGQYCVSTLERGNFEGRHGKNGRTILASPTRASGHIGRCVGGARRRAGGWRERKG